MVPAGPARRPMASARAGGVGRGGRAICTGRLAAPAAIPSVQNGTARARAPSSAGQLAAARAALSSSLDPLSRRPQAPWLLYADCARAQPRRRRPATSSTTPRAGRWRRGLALGSATTTSRVQGRCRRRPSPSRCVSRDRRAMDSELVVSRCGGIYRVKNDGLKPLFGGGRRCPRASPAPIPVPREQTLARLRATARSTKLSA